MDTLILFLINYNSVESEISDATQKKGTAFTPLYRITASTEPHSGISLPK
jgi:hypothetical protein